MLVYNKYLKELGVKPDDYPLDKGMEPNEDGIIPEHLWNLDLTMAMEMYTYIRAFQDAAHGIPMRYTAKQWNTILQKIADGVAWKITKADDCYGDEWKKGEALFRRALFLLSENWDHLWY